MRNKNGFTLVEILIVVLMLGLLAAIVLPRFSNASATARASMLADDLRVIRTQLSVYKAQHTGVAPGYPVAGGAANEATFVAQMTMATNTDGATQPVGTPNFDLGPYLREMPVNPFNDKTSIRILADAQAFPNVATGDFGWIYKPATLKFKADAVGQDEDGKDFIDY